MMESHGAAAGGGGGGVPRILLFGDSITQRGIATGGWAALGARYERKCDVVVRGLSGYNTRWARGALPWVLRDLGAVPRVACVWFGANDVSSGSQAVPLVEFEDNLDAIVATLVGARIALVLLLTPPPVDEAAWPDRRLEDTRAYAAAATRVAARAGGRVAAYGRRS